MGVRRDFRFQVQCPVDFVADGRSGKGIAYNLSRSGCAIESDNLVDNDDPISLRIAIADGSNPVSIDLGKVRWNNKREFGVEFIVVGTEQKKVLDEFLVEIAKHSSVT